MTAGQAARLSASTGTRPPRTRVGAYVLGNEIGSGSQGTVYQATRWVPEGRSGQPVCIKLLGHGVAISPKMKLDFQRETEIAASFTHPNVVSFLEACPDDPEGGWIAMELVDGPSLRTLLRSLPPKHRLSPELALLVASNVCSALVCLHEQQRSGQAEPIVHRDVTSSNVLIAGRWGSVKLADFGLARVMRALREPQTMPAGTLHYMAPEQANGHAIDGRSDVFSLGVVLYEMLAGHLPVQAPLDAEITRRLAAREYQPLREANPDVPKALAAIVELMMQPQPSKRFQTARACLHAFSELAKSELPLPLDLSLELGDLAYEARRHATLDPEAVLREHRLSGSGSAEAYLQEVAATAQRASEPVQVAAVAAAAEQPTLVLPRGPKPTSRQRVRTGLFAAAAAVTLPLAFAATWGLQHVPAPADLTPPSDAHDLAKNQHQDALQTSIVPPPRASLEAHAEAAALSTVTPVSGPSAPPPVEPVPAQKADDKQVEVRHAKRTEAELTVGAMPSAQVWVDGRVVGWSPVNVKVKAGRHSVGIGAQRPEKQALRWISVRDGEHLDVVFDQQPLASLGGRDEQR